MQQPSDANINALAVADQVGEAIKPLVAMIGSYFKELIRTGFQREEALELSSKRHCSANLV